jgi:hypothetical protein
MRPPTVICERYDLGILGRLSEPDVKAVERALRTILGAIDTVAG